MEGINLEIEHRKKEIIIRVHDGFKNNWKFVKRIAITRDEDGEVDVFIHRIEPEIYKDNVDD